MTPKEFFLTVMNMGEQQRQYFKTRSKDALKSSKELEKRVDAEIARVKAECSNDPDINPTTPQIPRLPL